MDAIARQYH